VGVETGIQTIRAGDEIGRAVEETVVQLHALYRSTNNILRLKVFIQREQISTCSGSPP
jgi:hypothetical protein